MTKIKKPCNAFLVLLYSACEKKEIPLLFHDPAHPPSSKLMDISLLVAETDYYHIECQMGNDRQMVIRMISYDLHHAIEHCISGNCANDEIILRFPHSIVLYPDQNLSLPDSLKCRVIFQDGSDYINLLIRASEHIFYHHPAYHKEVQRMTKPLIILPSMEIAQLKASLAERDSALAEKDSEIAALRAKLESLNHQTIQSTL